MKAPRWVEEPFHALMGILLALSIGAAVTGCGGKHSTKPVVYACTEELRLPSGKVITVPAPCPSPPLPKPTPSPQPCWPPPSCADWPKPPVDHP